jgi:hypothetical protein
MSDQVKLSFSNALVVVGLVLSGGITYASLQSRIANGETVDVKQNERIEKLEYGAIEAQSERDEARIRDEYTVDALRRIEEWIKEIDQVKEI